MQMMGWMSSVFVLVTLHYVSMAFGVPHNLQELEQVPEDTASVDLGSTDPLMEVQNEDQKLKELGTYLTYILTNPWPKTGLPILYVEEYSDAFPEDNENLDVVEELNESGSDETARPIPFKRSRYYRKYPWKRQNSRQTYEAENRYLCQPSKDDVFRLLVALHEARQGNRGRTINFCNRKRPASAIFTNIRFLGKRK